MTSRYLEKIPSIFELSPFPETAPLEEEAVIVMAGISDIMVVELPSGEMERAGSLTSLNARRSYLGGRYLVRGLLAQWLGIRSRDVPISVDPSGKPFLGEGGMLHFSISHTDDLIAVVFSSRLVGIDLERKRPLDCTALAQRFFSPEEAEFMNHQGTSPDFFRLWSCREAAIKGDGRGLGALLSRVKIAPASLANSERVEVSVEGVLWKTIPWILRGGIHGSVAFHEVPRVIRWCDLR